jgi:hypothetical protein
MPEDNDRFSGLTEQTAELGCILTPQGVTLALAERWYEDGLHVIRSTEFDLIAEHEDPATVVDIFVDNLVDYALGLSELQVSGDITEHEQQTLALIAPRFYEAARQTDLENRRRRVRVHLRQRDQRTGHWRQQTQRANFTTLSPA